MGVPCTVLDFSRVSAQAARHNRLIPWRNTKNGESHEFIGGRPLKIQKPSQLGLPPFEPEDGPLPKIELDELPLKPEPLLLELEPELQFQTSAIGAAVAALFSSGTPNMVSMVARVL
jgi:hypothetical protein